VTRLPLTDGHVVVRRWEAEDAPALVAALQDSEIARWTQIPFPYRDADARAFFTLVAQREAAGEAHAFAVCDADGGALLGGIGLNVDREQRIGEIGYWTAAAVRRRGVATRAVRLVARWALEEVGLPRVEILVQPGNAASQGVAESAGLRREELLPRHREHSGELRDFIRFAIDRDQPAG